MKIVFFKNEEHFYPRISFTCDNAEGVSLDDKLAKFKYLLIFVLSLPFSVFFVVNFGNFRSNPLLLIAISFLCLPIHELCHAAFCWICGKKVERINFFPYLQIVTKPMAYVVPALDVWKKHQVVLLYLFPFIILTAVPFVLSIVFPSLKLWLLLISLLNLSASVFDIMKAAHVIRFPKGLLYFLHFTLKVADKEKPVIIHRIAVTPKKDEIYHTCFECFENKLTETKNVYDTPDTVELKREFKDQFNMQ